MRRSCSRRRRRVRSLSSALARPELFTSSRCCAQRCSASASGYPVPAIRRSLPSSCANGRPSGYPVPKTQIDRERIPSPPSLSANSAASEPDAGQVCSLAASRHKFLCRPFISTARRVRRTYRDSAGVYRRLKIVTHISACSAAQRARKEASLQPGLLKRRFIRDEARPLHASQALDAMLRRLLGFPAAADAGVGSVAAAASDASPTSLGLASVVADRLTCAVCSEVRQFSAARAAFLPQSPFLGCGVDICLDGVRPSWTLRAPCIIMQQAGRAASGPARSRIIVFRNHCCATLIFFLCRYCMSQCKAAACTPSAASASPFGTCRRELRARPAL